MSDSVSKYFEKNEDINVVYTEVKEDTIVKSVVRKYQERSEVGIKKYGVTLDREDLSFIDWMNHLQQELMDASLYIEKIIKENEQS